MDLFSSLKTAYDSIGSEISKSFDSTDFEKQSTPAPNTQPRAEEEPTTQPVPRTEPQEISGHKVALIQLHHDCTHTHTHRPSPLRGRLLVIMRAMISIPRGANGRTHLLGRHHSKRRAAPLS